MISGHNLGKLLLEFRSNCTALQELSNDLVRDSYFLFYSIASSESALGASPYVWTLAMVLAENS